MYGAKIFNLRGGREEKRSVTDSKNRLSLLYNHITQMSIKLPRVTQVYKNDMKEVIPKACG